MRLAEELERCKSIFTADGLDGHVCYCKSVAEGATFPYCRPMICLMLLISALLVICDALASRTFSSFPLHATARVCEFARTHSMGCARLYCCFDSEKRRQCPSGLNWRVAQPTHTMPRREACTCCTSEDAHNACRCYERPRHP